MVKKNTKDNPIKRIGLDVPPMARPIVFQIASALGFKIVDDKDENGNIIGLSAYNDNGIRLSDHRTYLQTWVDMGTWELNNKYSIVIEDIETIGQTQVKNGYDFEVIEYVVKSKDMNVEKAKIIAYDIKNAIETGVYANNINADKSILKSSYNIKKKDIPMSNTTNKAVKNKENKNENIDMKNKNVIRINEVHLRNMISESVRNVLNENLNESVDYKQMFYDNVIKAQQYIEQALSFVDTTTEKDILVKQIIKVYNIINEVSYFIRERTK